MNEECYWKNVNYTYADLENIIIYIYIYIYIFLLIEKNNFIKMFEEIVHYQCYCLLQRQFMLIFMLGTGCSNIMTHDLSTTG